MLGYLVAVFAIAALCAGWALVQLWVGKADPHAGLQAGCLGCVRDCGERCIGKPARR